VWWLFPAAIAAIALYPHATLAATKAITNADKGSTIHLKAGDALEVRLQSTPSTGYLWYVHPKSTPLLKLNGQTQTGPAQSGASRPIYQVFTFKTGKRGEGILLLRSVRSWEKPAANETQFSVHVYIE
jgi:predicted secreted protein